MANLRRRTSGRYAEGRLQPAGRSFAGGRAYSRVRLPAQVRLHRRGNLVANDGWGGCLVEKVAREEGLNSNGARFSGMVFAFISFRFHHLPHLVYLFSGWMAAILEANDYRPQRYQFARYEA